jgi:hypothetical protein
MVARVTHYRIREGKLAEFTATVQSLTAALDKLNGFRVLLVLRAEDPASRDAMAIPFGIPPWICATATTTPSITTSSRVCSVVAKASLPCTSRKSW